VRLQFLGLPAQSLVLPRALNLLRLFAWDPDLNCGSLLRSLLFLRCLGLKASSIVRLIEAFLFS